eukprot:765915-Hanusia_phi.AAC.4
MPRDHEGHDVATDCLVVGIVVAVKEADQRSVVVRLLGAIEVQNALSLFHQFLRSAPCSSNGWYEEHPRTEGDDRLLESVFLEAGFQVLQELHPLRLVVHGHGVHLKPLEGRIRDQINEEP